MEGIYQVGGPDQTDSSDCMVYLVTGSPCVLIDAGAGASAPEILSMAEACGCPRDAVGYLILTHCHVDHIGGASYFVRQCPQIKLIAHADDAEAVQTGDPVRTAATWYGITLPPLTLDILFEGEETEIDLHPAPLTLIHTPGHTPGSCVALVEREGTRVLFGQDIHGPFMPEFGSDLAQWRRSMERLLALEADILCEGHYGILRGKEKVRSFIEHHLALQGF